MAIAVAFVVALVLTPVVIAALQRRRLLDLPNERSSHRQPVPRGGGVAVAVGALAGLAIRDDLSGRTAGALALSAIAFGVIGLADDLSPVPALVRLGLQVIAAAAATVLLLDDLTGSRIWQATFAVGCVLWLVSYVNAFNFMDGINGISAAQAVVAGASWFVLGTFADQTGFAVAGALVAAAAVGFLPFNFPRARVFLGDVGSYFVGAWLATTAVIGIRLGIAPEAVIAPLVLYLADTSTTIIRRVRADETWHAAHRSHAYQRLIDLGWSHTRTTACAALTMALCSALAVFAAERSTAARVIASGSMIAVVAVFVSLPSLLARPGTIDGSALSKVRAGDVASET